MTTSEWLPNFGLLMLALLFACFVPGEQRRQALLCWALIFTDWLVYVTSWSPFAAAYAFRAAGLDIHSTDIWPVMDAITAATIVALAYDRSWAWGLWCCLAAQVCRHVAYQIVGGGFDPYTNFLDLFFWGQIACFLLIGGRGVRDCITHNYHRLRDGLGSLAPARPRQAARRRA